MAKQLRLFRYYEVLAYLSASTEDRLAAHNTLDEGLGRPIQSAMTVKCRWGSGFTVCVVDLDPVAVRVLEVNLSNPV